MNTTAAAKTPALKTDEELRLDYVRNRVSAQALCAKHGVRLTREAFNAVAREHMKPNRYLSEASRWTVASREARITFEAIEEGYYEEACDMADDADVARAKASLVAAYTRLAASV